MRLANGRVATYYCAWRRGPRLPGEPRSPEFMAAWQEATKARQPRHGATLLRLLNEYQRSAAFTDLAPRTRADYIRHIRAIETEFGDLPIAAMADRRVRGDVFAWRDRMAKSSPRQADYAVAVLARVLAWAHERGLARATRWSALAGSTEPTGRTGYGWRMTKPHSLPPHRLTCGWR